MRPAPAAPWLPREWHGKPIVALLACYSGKTEDGEKVVAPIKAFGTPIGDVLVRRPYAQLQTLFDAANPKGRRYYWKSEYLASASKPGLCEKAIEHSCRDRSPIPPSSCFSSKAPSTRLNAEHSPAGNRDAHCYVFNLAASWEKAEEEDTTHSIGLRPGVE